MSNEIEVLLCECSCAKPAIYLYHLACRGEQKVGPISICEVHEQVYSGFAGKIEKREK